MWAPPVIHAMRGPDDACGRPHACSQAMKIPRCVDWVTMMSAASARSGSSRVLSRTMKPISTACA